MNTRIQTYLYTKWPTIFWSAVIFVLLAMPGNGLLNETWFNAIHLDKLVHAFLFFILSWLWVMYVQQGKSLSLFLLVFLATTVTVYGIAMEFIQIYTGRDFSIGDMVADGTGAFLGAFLNRKK